MTIPASHASIVLRLWLTTRARPKHVHGAGRFVEDQQVGLAQQGACDADALALAAREPRSRSADPRLVGAARMELLDATGLRHGREWIERSGTANYRVLLHNKYLGREGMTDERFDFIVDNNPSTFGCCLTHFARMMEFYAGALAPGGQIVTDRLGLGWAMAHSNPRWAFDAADIAAFGRLFSLQTHAVGADIIVLAHGAPPRPPLKGRVAHGLRSLARRLKLRSRRPQPG
jgi:hypothetical protein